MAVMSSGSGEVTWYTINQSEDQFSRVARKICEVVKVLFSATMLFVFRFHERRYSMAPISEQTSCIPQADSVQETRSTGPLRAATSSSCRPSWRAGPSIRCVTLFDGVDARGNWCGATWHVAPCFRGVFLPRAIFVTRQQTAAKRSR